MKVIQKTILEYMDYKFPDPVERKIMAIKRANIFKEYLRNYMRLLGAIYDEGGGVFVIFHYFCEEKIFDIWYLISRVLFERIKFF